MNVVITGAGGGLGPAVVAAFKSAGATVHAPSRDELNVADEASVAKYYASLPDPLWACVHIVGGFAMSPLVDTTLADVRAQLDVNFVSAFLCTREAVRKMMRATGGRIVNVASKAAEQPAAQAAAYAASKAAVVALTKSAAAEARAWGILVNAISPTTIDTPANRKAMPNAAHDKWAKPEHIAAAVLWLCSTENRLTSGAVIPVAGTD